MSDERLAVDRRTLLASLGALTGAASLSGCSAFEAGADGDTTGVDPERARELAETFAPRLYFDSDEQWFPTDPRPYVTESDGETVVDGFAALDGYTADVKSAEAPPDPTLFYNAVEYVDSPLAVVQFWYYSVFDQFTTNFHWHDWEVLHVFVDTDTGEPQLYVASSHSGSVPNNEYLDPAADETPRILSELGSHSSALSLNEEAARFHRLPFGDTLADITNSAVEGVAAIANVPVAYGLPRGEGWSLPYLVPELNDAPVYEDDRLASVEQADLVPDGLTVGSLDEILSPPDTLKQRSTGLTFGYDSEVADVSYELAPSSELEHVEKFDGPQLSFEFAIPAFAENLIAGHITTTGVPWQQDRYDGPAADISDPTHRGAMAERYEAIGEPAPFDSVVARATEAVTDEEAPEDEGVTTEESGVESFVLLESEKTAVPTFQGVAVVQDVPAGEHRLTVNGAGVEPHSETVTVPDASEGGPTAAGVEGEIPQVARENSTKLEVDADGTDDELTRLAVEDDFAGRLYDAPLSGPDAVYVHRGGAYTTEVRDSDDEIGAFRVNPGDESRQRIDEPRTGKGSLASYLADVAAETASSVGAVEGSDDDTNTTDQPGGGSDGSVGGLRRALEAVAEAATRAAERAEAGEGQRADQSLETVTDRLETVSTRLADASAELPDDLERAIEHRFEQLERRSAQARDAGKL